MKCISILRPVKMERSAAGYPVTIWADTFTDTGRHGGHKGVILPFCHLRG